MNNDELDSYLFTTGSLEGAVCPDCNEPLIPDPEFPSYKGGERTFQACKRTRFACTACRIGVEDGGSIVGVLVTRKRTKEERWIENATGLLNSAPEHVSAEFKQAIQAELERLSEQ